MKKTLPLLFLIVSLTSYSALSQLPDTDIYLFTVKSTGGNRNFGKAVNITNRKGYDNQPCFSPDSKEILFVSIEDSSQSEIWKYDIKTNTKTQLTKTKESEYSPTFFNNGKNISTVRVDADSAQRFYLLDYPELKIAEVVKNSDSIGYSCWINDSLVSMFVVEDTSSMQLLDLKTHTRTYICNNPGRCMKINPKNKLLYFIDKNDSTNWYLSTLNLKTKKINRLVKTLPKSEDFAFFSDGTLICGFDGGIFTLTSKESAWKAIGKPMISMKNDFYRISISPDNKYIAVVSFSGKKP